MRPASLLFVPLLLALAGPAAAQTVGTFTLDGLSFVSFGDSEVLPLPAGSTLEFRFGTPQANGTTPFTIEPSGVAIGDVALPGGGVLRYGIADAAAGTLRPTTEGREIQFQARVRATLDKEGGGGSYEYGVPFTTESAAASNRLGTQTLQVEGMRLVDGVWYGQIVGATTNRDNAFPEPGAAVYTVLSGTFDQVP